MEPWLRADEHSAPAHSQFVELSPHVSFNLESCYLSAPIHQNSSAK
jgi:hypothetical protein